MKEERAIIAEHLKRDMIKSCNHCHEALELHLKTSIRSFRADKQSQFVDNLLDNKPKATSFSRFQIV